MLLDAVRGGASVRDALPARPARRAERVQQKARHPKISVTRRRAMLAEDDACQRQERKRRLQSMLGGSWQCARMRNELGSLRMSRAPLDPDREEMRRLGYEAIDRIVEHLSTLTDQRVAAPGSGSEFAALVDEALPLDGKG